MLFACKLQAEKFSKRPKEMKKLSRLSTMELKISGAEYLEF
jgi:hypothetical protein